ncbi:MAG: RsmD family RNA methyltransferase [Deltaproteobacteria bacterium]|nr:RsmD family RNA methyltransferase [Deltaproteobacteria bacterium]
MKTGVQRFLISLNFWIPTFVGITKTDCGDFFKSIENEKGKDFFLVTRHPSLVTFFMRIIAGQCKGHHLAPLKGGKTRPTQDRVRESIFNILEPYGPFLNVADLFAGSGALGLEALSRWGGNALFVEFSRPAVDCLRENIRRLKMETKSRLIQRDLSRGVRFLLNRHAPPLGRGTTIRLALPTSKGDIQRMSGHENKTRSVTSSIRELKDAEPFDLVFIDPPYGQGWCNVIVSAVLSLPLLQENGILVLEHDLKEPIPEKVGNWGIGDQRRYGQTRVSFYKFRKG